MKHHLICCDCVLRNTGKWHTERSKRREPKSRWWRSQRNGSLKNSTCSWRREIHPSRGSQIWASNRVNIINLLHPLFFSTFYIVKLIYMVLWIFITYLLTVTYKDKKVVKVSNSNCDHSNTDSKQSALNNLQLIHILSTKYLLLKCENWIFEMPSPWIKSWFFFLSVLFMHFQTYII